MHGSKQEQNDWPMRWKRARGLANRDLRGTMLMLKNLLRAFLSWGANWRLALVERMRGQARNTAPDEDEIVGEVAQVPHRGIIR